MLRLINANPETSQRELAQAVGISAECVHYVLSGLVENGMIEFVNLATAEASGAVPSSSLTRAKMHAMVVMIQCFLGRHLAEFDALDAQLDAFKTETADDATFANA